MLEFSSPLANLPVQISNALTDWRAEFSAAICMSNGSLVFNDGPGHGWHLLRFIGPQVAGRRVTVHAKLEPTKEGDAEFHVAHWGGWYMATIDRSGAVIQKGENVDVSVTKAGRVLDVTVAFDNVHWSVNLGCAKQRQGIYQGSNRDQFIFHEIAVTAEPIPIGPDSLILLDVGAAGGMQEIWQPFVRSVRPVFVEPSPAHAARLRQMYPSFVVVDAALSNRTGRVPLYVTRGEGCTSLRKVNDDFMRRYKCYPLFQIRETVEVDVTRYDRLVQQGVAPLPEALKIDVQGMEYEVIEGMGEVLDNVFAIELESHFYEVYKGQRLLGDIIRFLQKRGFYLRRVEPQMGYDCDVVECNAYFTKDRTEANARKLAMVEQTWKLITTTIGGDMAARSG